MVNTLGKNPYNRSIAGAGSIVVKSVLCVVKSIEYSEPIDTAYFLWSLSIYQHIRAIPITNGKLRTKIDITDR